MYVCARLIQISVLGNAIFLKINNRNELWGTFESSANSNYIPLLQLDKLSELQLYVSFMRRLETTLFRYSMVKVIRNVCRTHD